MWLPFMISQNDDTGTVHTGNTAKQSAKNRKSSTLSSRDLWLAKEVLILLCPLAIGYHDRELSHDNMDPESNEFHSGQSTGLTIRQECYHECKKSHGTLNRTADCADAVEAQCKRFEVSSSEDGRVLFSADEEEIVIGADRLKVTGTEGAVFEHSVETPHIRAEPSQDLKLESPTRSLIMEAPKGIQVSAAAGDLKATCRKELHLQSTEGEIFLNADSIRLGNLPLGSFPSSSSPSSSATRQTIYELCVCPNGKLYLSPAGAGSTCQSSGNICLWS
ncbi:zeta-sarcoglycan isoform 4-T4 [Liasis olivaceus]